MVDVEMGEMGTVDPDEWGPYNPLRRLTESAFRAGMSSGRRVTFSEVPEVLAIIEVYHVAQGIGGRVA